MENFSFFTAGDGTRIAYRIEGALDKPILILSNSIGTTMQMWDQQVPELSAHFRVLRYDTRGHGASDVPAGAYSLDRLGRDVVELLDALGAKKAHFLGLSLGGFIGQWMGIYASDRIDRLILSNTSSYLGPAKQWDERISSVIAAKDMHQSAEIFLASWFPVAMVARNGPVINKFRSMLLGMNREGLAGSYAVVRDTDLRRTVGLINVPTLVISGRDDTVTLLAHGEIIAAAIPFSKFVVLPTVHLSNVELPVEYTSRVIEFLNAH